MLLLETDALTAASSVSRTLPPRSASLPSLHRNVAPPPPSAPLPSIPSQFGGPIPPLRAPSPTLSARRPSWDGSATLGMIAMESMEQRARGDYPRSSEGGITDRGSTGTYSSPLASPATFFSSPPPKKSHQSPPPRLFAPPPLPNNKRQPHTSPSSEVPPQPNSSRVARTNTVTSGVSSASSGTRRVQRGNALEALEGRKAAFNQPPLPTNQRRQLPIKTPLPSAAAARASKPFLDWDDDDAENESFTHPFKALATPSPTPPPPPPLPTAAIPAGQPTERRVSGASFMTVGSALDPYFGDAGAPNYHPYTQQSNSVTRSQSRPREQRNSLLSVMSPNVETFPLDAFPVPPSPQGGKSSFWRRGSGSRKSSISESFLNV